MYEEKKIVYIDVDELGIDRCNVRKGIWEHDEELINSIRERGVRVPLLVRPALPDEGKKYGIVYGSRRYNAAVEGGKDKVPCIIEEMDDVDATLESMIENRQRKGIPTWADVESIGEIFYRFTKNEGLAPPIAIEKIYHKTGIGEPKIKQYIRIYDLPEELKGLLRDPENRTQRQGGYLSLFRLRETSRTLSFGKADLLTELKRFPLEKQMEVAVFILDKSEDVAQKIIEFVKVYPKKSVEDIYNDVVEKEYGPYQRTLRFDRETWDAVSNACVDKQTHYDDLLAKVIKNWLKNEGYLRKPPKLKLTVGKDKDFGKLEEFFSAQREGYVKVRTSPKKLTDYGYHFLKKEGKTLIYQRHIPKCIGYYKAFYRGGIAWLKLTPGNYDNPDRLLNAEKDRLECREKT